MTTRYEVVKARNSVEALEASQFKLGALCKVIQVETVANGDGTFSVFPIVEPIQQLKGRCGCATDRIPEPGAGDGSRSS